MGHTSPARNVNIVGFRGATALVATRSEGSTVSKRGQKLPEFMAVSVFVTPVVINAPVRSINGSLMEVPAETR